LQAVVVVVLIVALVAVLVDIELALLDKHQVEEVQQNLQLR
jgi:hypothetical protein